MMGVLDRLTRSIERPQVPLSQGADETFEALGARRSDSGVVVNRVTALRHHAIWRGVTLLARDAAKLQLLIYQREGEGKRRADSHPAYRLLKNSPNGQMTAFVFKQTLTAHAILHGNGYALISRRGDGAPVELLPLLPDRTYPVRENGRLLYVTSIGGTLEDPGSTIRVLLPENVLHIKGLGYDGLCGYSLIDFGADTIGGGMAKERYSSKFFANSARPSVVIEHPGSISETAAKRLKDSWNTLHQGVENSHKTAILEEGMKLHAFSINAKDAELHDGQKFDLVKIANLLGVPPHKVGGEGRTSYNSLEQENQAYLDEGLDPWLVAWEEECREKLLTEEEKRNDSHVVEFLRNALVRADLSARTQSYNMGLQNGYYNRDEVRAMENMNPMPDGEGQKFYVPLNMKTTGDDEEEASQVATSDQTALAGSLAEIVEKTTAGTMPKESAKGVIKASFPKMTDQQVNSIIDPIEVKEPEPPPAPIGAPLEEKPDDDARTALLSDAISRACRVVGVWARRAAKDSKTFGDWLEQCDAKNRESVVEILDATARVCQCSRDEMADKLFAEIRRVLDDCYSTKSESEFASSVDECMNHCETAFAATLAESILKGQS